MSGGWGGRKQGQGNLRVESHRREEGEVNQRMVGGPRRRVVNSNGAIVSRPRRREQYGGRQILRYLEVIMGERGGGPLKTGSGKPAGLKHQSVSLSK